jgi:hypothetical protein
MDTSFQRFFSILPLGFGWKRGGNNGSNQAEEAEMSDPKLSPMPTNPEAVPLSRLRRAQNGRRVILAAVIGFLLVGAANLLGVRQETVSATGGGYRLSVTYTSVTRPGLVTPWSFTVEHPGGFDGPITVAATQSYFDLFDHNVFYPDVAKSTASDGRLIWEFDPPPGDTLTVLMDARMEPTEQLSRAATTSVLVEGQPVATVHYTTRVVP